MTHQASARRAFGVACVAALSVLASQARADMVTLTFGNERNQANIQNYFNGGNDSLPQYDGTGPSDGVVFGGSAEALKSAAASGTGKFENNPSGANGVLYFAFSASTAPIMNVASGFTSLSLDYSLLNNLPQYGGTIQLWSGLNGTGTLLYTMAQMSPNAAPVACTSHSDEFCSWSLATTGGANFGIAESATFGTNSTVPYTEFDSVQLSTVPLPESSGLMLTGLALLALTRLRKTRGDAR